MVAVVLIHMAQVFLFGAYKFPRELTWILGVFMLLMTLGMAFTGQVLRFDQDAYWGLGIGASIVGRVPFDRRPACAPHAGRADHQRRNAHALFCAACVHYSGHAARVHRAACVDGAEARASTSGRCRDASCGAKHMSRSTTNWHTRMAFHLCPARCGRTWFSPRRFCLRLHVCAALFGPYGPKGVPDPDDHQHGAQAGLSSFCGSTRFFRSCRRRLETPFILIVPVVGVAMLLWLCRLLPEWARRAGGGGRWLCFR